MHGGHIPAVKQVDDVWRIMPNVHIWTGDKMPELQGESPEECAAWIFSKRRQVGFVHVLDARDVITGIVRRGDVDAH